MTQKEAKERILLANEENNPSLLPEKMHIRAGLKFSKEERQLIKFLPTKLKVEGDLDLYGTQIQTLPDNLTVGGYLDLHDTPIQALPDNLTVGGCLFLSGTQTQ